MLCSHGASAEVSVIANSAQATNLNEQKVTLTEQSLYNLYLGIEKNSRFELLNQSEGQAARVEFFEKFLRQSEIQLKKKWSMLIFSGNRVPLNLTDDNAIFEYVKTHPNSVGYVDSGFLSKMNQATNKATDKTADKFVVLFKIQ